jgi:2'-5' RNA ligase
MLTLFAAIKPPDDILDKVETLQKGVEGVRWGPRENLHITLGYFGLVSEEMAEVLDHELARSFGVGFDLQLQGTGIFGGSRPHTLWLGLQESKELVALHKHCRSAARRAKVEMEARKFAPHLSLAYMNNGISLADLSRYVRRHDNFKSKSFLVDEFSLYSSNPQKSGPNLYVKEANYPLLG